MKDDIEHQLARRFSRGLHQTAGQCPTEMELASYVDGLATEAEAARIEAHLAGCPQCLEGVVSARELAVAPEAAPSRLVARAKALVPLRRRLGWRRIASWAAAAAACAALGFAGLRAGTAVAQAKGQSQAGVMSALSFEPPEPYQALLSSDDLLAAAPLAAKEGSDE